LEEVSASVDKVLAEREASFKSAKARGERVAELEAEKIVRETAAGPDGVRGVAKGFEGVEANFGIALGPAVGAHVKTVAIFGGSECGDVVVGEHPSVGKDMNALLKKVLGEVDGKGGGTKDFARGGLTDSAKAQEAIDIARKELGL